LAAYVGAPRLAQIMEEAAPLCPAATQAATAQAGIAVLKDTGGMHLVGLVYHMHNAIVFHAHIIHQIALEENIRQLGGETLTA